MYKDMDLEKQLYYGSITAMDEQIGRLWNKLEEMGITDNTLLFFCSDNGPERDTPGSAGIFKERKRSLYEGGVRVPAFGVWKNHFEGGKRLDFPMSTSDYLPTIVDLLNIKFPDDRPMDGISVLDVLKGSNKQRSKAIGFICTPQISWVTHQYKLITDEKLSKFELYDLLNDKAEKHDIIKEFPEVAKNMKIELLLWLESVERSKQGLDYR
jgi:arylsulfatase A-like enzyme